MREYMSPKGLYFPGDVLHVHRLTCWRLGYLFALLEPPTVQVVPRARELGNFESGICTWKPCRVFVQSTLDLRIHVKIVETRTHTYVHTIHKSSQVSLVRHTKKYLWSFRCFY